MARNIFIVNATQVVTSESHPEGLFSVVSGYPKNFDSRSYPVEGSEDGNSDKALQMAKAEYFSRLSANYASDTRAMWTVTLEMANGRTVMHESVGAFPVVEPEPPVNEEEPEQTEEP